MQGSTSFDVTKNAVENSKWTRANTWTFISFAIGVMMQASFYSWAYLATGWYPITSPTLKYLLLIWPGIWFIVGIMFMGVISDRIGRKPAFFMTMAIYVIAAVGILLSFNYYLVLVFIAVSQVAGGGETNVAIASIPEMFPTRVRAKVLYLVYSFVSIGPAIFAGIDFLSISSQVTFQRELVAASAIPLLAILLISRFKMPESIRWLEAKGRKKDAENAAQKYYGKTVSASAAVTQQAPSRQRTSIALKLLVVTLLSIANIIGFGIFVFDMGPIYFPSLTSLIIFVSDLIEAIVTIGFAFIVDRVSRKWNVFVFYLGTLVMAIIIALTVSIWSTSANIFWVILGAMNVFLALGYVAENTLKGEIWPTGRRATYTGIARTIAYVLNVPATLYLYYLSLTGFAVLNVVLWTIGIVGATIWLLKGRETGKYTSVGVASEEE
ncbi:MAG: MFS transporter [Nitrososphaerota archaeon]|jgi:MFS family permease|nr:MFS transporter [Nitrososphaerota archaeon]MDG6932409.1 MFS transporter [Nitrososphaerota archaeon]MDG6935394.1 MFS transporter [Nitrososphaerota archaeon]